MRYGATGKRLSLARALLKQLSAMKDSIDTAEEESRLYKVELAPEEDQYLLWDQPLSEQSEKVKAALKGAEIPNWTYEELMENGAKGQSIYRQLSYGLGRNIHTGTSSDDKAASEYLHSLGIRGIKYLDGSSRPGTFNAANQQDAIDSVTKNLEKNKKDLAYWEGLLPGDERNRMVKELTDASILPEAFRIIAKSKIQLLIFYGQGRGVTERYSVTTIHCCLAHGEEIPDRLL
jgi:hypothetical protein